MQQLTTIPLLYHDQVSLADFIGDHNRANQKIVAQLLKHEKSLIFYFYGESGAGKTHLLHSYCKDALIQDLAVIYFDCAQNQLDQALVEGFSQCDWICIDNIDLCTKIGQYALYSLYNICRTHHKVLMLSANTPPNSLNINLMDLKTRLVLSHYFALEVLNNGQKKQILAQKMSAQNININQDIYDYLLLNYSRNLSRLVAVLFFANEQAILKQKKNIKLAFIKEILGKYTSLNPAL